MEMSGNFTGRPEPSRQKEEKVIESLLLRVVMAGSHFSVLTLPDGILIYVSYITRTCDHMLGERRLIQDGTEIEILLY